MQLKPFNIINLKASRQNMAHMRSQA